MYAPSIRTHYIVKFVDEVVESLRCVFTDPSGTIQYNSSVSSVSIEDIGPEQGI